MNIKIVCLIPLALVLTGCAAASADPEYTQGECIEIEVSLADGYYLSNNDNSYIHIEDGEIGLCDYDYTAAFTSDWNALDGDKASLDEYVDISAEALLYQISLQKYTPVKFVGMGENGGDLNLLAVHYKTSLENNTYYGYILNDDGTISKIDNIYTYEGTELPVE